MRRDQHEAGSAPETNAPAAPGAARPWLPDLIRRCWDTFGEAAARRLATHFGGLDKVFIPSAPMHSNPIAKHVGYHVLVWLCQLYPKMLIRVPLATSLARADRDKLIRRQFDNGMLSTDIARHHKVAQRTVWRALARTRSAARQQKQGVSR
jgi:hypothetical protein